MGPVPGGAGLKKKEGALIRRARESTGLSLGRLSREIYFSVSYLSDVERDKRHASDKLLAAMATVSPEMKRAVAGIYRQRIRELQERIQAIELLINAEVRA